MNYYTEPETPREIRGQEIAKKSNIKRENGFWSVPSQSGKGKYKVTLSPLSCECPDFEIRRKRCKHIHAVGYRFEREFLEDLTRDEIAGLPKPVSTRKTYPQVWSAYNQAQTNEKSEFQKILAELCKGVGEPSQKFGRPRLPFNDMLFACIFKVYSTFSGRRFMTDLNESQKKGLISKVPNYNSIFNYFANEELTPYLQMMIEESSLPLKAFEEHFAVDASGLSTTHGFTWHFAKFEEPRLISKRNWLKLHLCVGTKTNVVTAVRITSQNEHDTHYFEPLVRDTRENFDMKTVSADKGYLSQRNMNVALWYDAVPFIAFKSNSKPSKNNAVWNKLFHFFSMHQEKYLKNYHRRSNVETAFAMIKAKFGGTLRSKTKTAQINEALCKVLAHNICCLNQEAFELGIKTEFWKVVESA